jgi:ABC-2 type transport system ATP-binding protein/transposase
MEAMQMSYWAKAEIDRDQIALIPLTLSDRIPEDHSVRLFWELLSTYDWQPWEARYCGCHGQPPIHPRIVAGVLLYGLTQGIRSSRRLEWACGHAVDFMWLAEGRVIDHSTLCAFRTTFRHELKDLFRHLGRLARVMGVVRLNCVAFDGTRVAANSSRHGTRTAESIEAELAKLDALFDGMLAEAEAVDERESATLFGEDVTPVTSLSKELASAKARQTKLRKAVDVLKARQASGSRQRAVAVSDPEAPILPNKGGGFAPNHTPVNAVDSGNRFIVAETVVGDEGEARALPPLLADTEATHGQAPEKILADSGFCTPGNLEALADHPTDAYLAPSGQRLEGENQTPSSKPNAAHRADPRVPVPSDRHDALPRNEHGRLSKEAFLYDEPSDCYWCPMGKPLAFVRIEQEDRDGQVLERRVYGCASCAGCPLRPSCTDRKRNRRIRSNGKNPLREAMALKVHSETGRRLYRQRQSVAESPFGVIKAVMGVRQFLLRGLQNVRTEWRWICTAYNLRILVKWVRRQRSRWANAQVAQG